MADLLSGFIQTLGGDNPLFDLLLGGGALGASALSREVPGDYTEARQFLRNQYASPEGIPSQVADETAALAKLYEPLLRQQEDSILNNVQQRVIAGRPSSLSTAMGGPEVAAIRDATVNQLIPRRQALLNQLAMQVLAQRTNAAKAIMSTAQVDPTGQALGQLGSSLLLRALMGQGGSNGGLLSSLLGGGSGTGISDLLKRIIGGNGTSSGPFGTIIDSFGQGGSAGITSLMQALGLSGGTANPEISSQLTAALSKAFGTNIGAFEPLGQNGAIGILDEAGNTIGSIGQNGTVINQATGQTLGSLANGTGFEGLLGAPSFSSLSGLFSGLGSGFAGYGLGDLLASHFTGDSELGSSAAGAGAGALSGFLIGGPVGAVIGSLTGLVGGFLGSSRYQQMQKAAALAADQKSQGTTASSIGSFWTEALGAAGYNDLDGWNALVQQTMKDVNESAKTYSYGGISVTADQPDNLAAIGSQLLLKQIQQEHPEYTSLDMVPGFRDKYISFILGNTYIQSGSSVAKTSDISQKQSLLTYAGL